jgi:hypothetical protein
MDAFQEMHRGDGFMSPPPPALSMRTVLKLAILLTVLIGATVIASFWRVPRAGPTPAPETELVPDSVVVVWSNETCQNGQVTRANFCSDRSSWSGFLPKSIGQYVFETSAT